MRSRQTLSLSHHTPKPYGTVFVCLSQYIAAMRILYLYITRTTFEIFNCCEYGAGEVLVSLSPPESYFALLAPTSPPDGNTYMSGQTDIPCNVPGGVQQTLVGPAVITLIVYSLLMPICTLAVSLPAC